MCLANHSPPDGRENLPSDTTAPTQRVGFTACESDTENERKKPDRDGWRVLCPETSSALAGRRQIHVASTLAAVSTLSASLFQMVRTKTKPLQGDARKTLLFPPRMKDQIYFSVDGLKKGARPRVIPNQKISGADTDLSEGKRGMSTFSQSHHEKQTATPLRSTLFLH
jgi:hypothetical protein